jgi:hypothetical protein
MQGLIEEGSQQNPNGDAEKFCKLLELRSISTIV